MTEVGRDTLEAIAPIDVEDLAAELWPASAALRSCAEEAGPGFGRRLALEEPAPAGPWPCPAWL